MTVEFFDLGRRLYAERTGVPVLQVAASLFSVTDGAIFVDAHREGDKGGCTFTVYRPGRAAVAAKGLGALRALGNAGAVMDSAQPPAQLIAADSTTLTALEAIARSAARHDDPAVRSAAAVVGWWSDRSDYPGTNAVVSLLDHSRQRFLTGATPEQETHASYWRGVFAVPAGVPGLVQWARRLSGGSVLPMLAAIREDDERSYQFAAERCAKGYSWTHADPAPIAAMALRARCDAADLWEAALLSDRLWRHRAVHTGHVTGGEVVSATRSTFTISCPRMGSRLRAGSAVVGWSGGVDSYDRADPFQGDVQNAEVRDGALQLTICRVRVDQRPIRGQWVTLMPAPPNDRIVRMGRARYRTLLFKGDSWIAAGKVPGVRRRDVPLDVLCAAAETD